MRMRETVLYSMMMTTTKTVVITRPAMNIGDLSSGMYIMNGRQK